MYFFESLSCTVNISSDRPNTYLCQEEVVSEAELYK